MVRNVIIDRVYYQNHKEEIKVKKQEYYKNNKDTIINDKELKKIIKKQFENRY